MKLLIIAGPYEADRIRKAAVPAGFETVAVEPGESLSGWITATRPDLIVMAPQIVHADPATALAKVRAVPRGRVPIFLVGDAADEAALAGLADGFFLRPISAEALVQRAREVGGSGSGPHAAAGAVAAPVGREPSQGSGRRARTSEGLGPLRPLVASASKAATAATPAGARAGVVPCLRTGRRARSRRPSDASRAKGAGGGRAPRRGSAR
jgi:CheY-like chemotaxis protein